MQQGAINVVINLVRDKKLDEKVAANTFGVSTKKFKSMLMELA